MKNYTSQDQIYFYGYWKNQVKDGLVLLRRPHRLGWATSFVRPRNSLRRVETRLFGGEAFVIYEEN
jgi:hypothetical protein